MVRIKVKEYKIHPEKAPGHQEAAADLTRPAEVVNVCMNQPGRTSSFMAPSLSVLRRVKVNGLKASLLSIFV